MGQAGSPTHPGDGLGQGGTLEGLAVSSPALRMALHAVATLWHHLHDGDRSTLTRRRGWACCLPAACGARPTPGAGWLGAGLAPGCCP